MNVDALSGRELDAAIAREVFGLKVESRTNARTRGLNYVHEVHPGQWVRVSFYSGSMGASLNVVEELHRRGWEQTDGFAAVHFNGSGDFHVVLKHLDGRVVEVDGPRNVALCRAALKALEPNR